MPRKSEYGLSQLPPLFTRPLWRDRFFWLIVATALFWVAAIGYFFL